jgi:hypothetical protein
MKAYKEEDFSIGVHSRKVVVARGYLSVFPRSFVSTVFEEDSTFSMKSSILEITLIFRSYIKGP